MSADANEFKANTRKVESSCRMTYVEDQACNLPKVERAKISKPSQESSNKKEGK